ncbi:lantibiotic dehydratase [Kutzneria viridogrisea]|uniref:Thiopeptide-type bacteriocin biosynthesis protein n=1 Tax=Kutzneria viridogrisea TaxID=47990 RepID=A0ABR6BRF8_9PSEU|nr:thiopeptide-type bacteriocin biosynthesis protein [Kutzneria viridogrisea]
MRTPGTKSLYQHSGVGLVRAAVAPLDSDPGGWPDLADPQLCRAWLKQTWSLPGMAEAITQASPTLADSVNALLAGRVVQPKQVRRVTLSTLRYLLRATGRHTPFGLFAGVAPVTVQRTAQVRWGKQHRTTARVDAEWLTAVITRLEACPQLLERMEVVFTNLAVRRGARLEAPHGPNRASIRHTRVVGTVREVAAGPVVFTDLADTLVTAFPSVSRGQVVGLLTDLVCQGFLITGLRAPVTATDPLAHLLDRLHQAGADTIADVAALAADLDAVRAAIDQHNHETTSSRQAYTRAVITRRMGGISTTGRTPLAVDLRLDCQVQIPERVAREMEHAASALVRLTRQPTGQAVWREFYTAFCDRYGVGSLVPLAEVVNPATGIGLPATYPGSLLPEPPVTSSDRDRRLLALAWHAAHGSGEIVLTEDTITALAVGDPGTEPCIPPHVELAARVHATSIDALTRGDFTLTVAPARSAGTLTARFATLTPGSGLAKVYAGVPVATHGALPAQLSFPPVHGHAENVARVPAFLPHVLPLGEHREPGEHVIAVDDLAVTATRHGLHLVSLSRRQVIEPQVFSALALDKQPPPLARFLAHLSRALGAAWTEFDWGPQAELLPRLPRVRYRHSVLAPARWRLTSHDLPATGGDPDRWWRLLGDWRRHWGCPALVELRDADRTLRLDLSQPSHAALVYAHLNRSGHAVLTETPNGAGEFGWIGGHAHEIALPLVSTRPPAPSPLGAARPVVTNREHGHLPGAVGTDWLYAKIHTHPERIDELITEHLPALLADLDHPSWWFVRYRSPHETDHLRLRLRTPDPQRYATSVTAVGAWARRLRAHGMAGRLVLDTYHPETGRYGHGTAMTEAEEVFAADSAVVAAQLRHLPAAVVPAPVLTALNMVGTVCGLLGGHAEAMRWLAATPVASGPATDRTLLRQVLTLTRDAMPPELPGWRGEVATAWTARAATLAAYRAALPTNLDIGPVVESLLHMHLNRARGTDPAGERACRRLARHAGLAWTAQHDNGDPR